MRLATLIPVILILLAACTEQQLVDDEPRDVRPPELPPITRPEIPRVDLPPEPPRSDPGIIVPEWVDFLNTEYATMQPRDGLLVGDVERPFIFGSKVGEAIPVLTRQELSMLATPSPIARGRPLRHEALIRFDFGEETTGELRFELDPDDEYPRSEVFFAEEEPMFEYAYLLYEGSFPILLDQEIIFFGHRYVVADVANTTLELHGVDTEQQIVLTNGSRLWWNGKRYPDTHVEVNPWGVTIRYLAPDDGVRLRAGERLRDHLAEPGILLNDAFDIIYDGLEQNNEYIVSLQGGETVKLSYTDKEPRRIEIATATPDGWRFGDEESRLVTTRCSRPCIALGERFLLNMGDGSTHVFEWTSVSEETISLRDRTTGERHVVALEEISDTRKDGTMTLYEYVHMIRVDTEQELLSVADARYRHATIPLRDGFELRLDEGLEFYSPPKGFLKEERIAIDFRNRNGELLVGTDRELEQGDDSRFFIGTTTRGVMIILKDADGRWGEDLQILYPSDFRAGLLRVTG